MTTMFDRHAAHPAGSALRLRALPGPSHGAPTRLSEDDLLWLARHYGTSCVTPWADSGLALPSERVFELVEHSLDFEVWVIHWPSGAYLQMHDHGGVAGAFWVAWGSLEEKVPMRGTVHHRVLSKGDGIAFGPTHLHQVLNHGDQVATSVHVYSPPIPQMTFFNTDGGGILPERTEIRSGGGWSLDGLADSNE